MSSQIVTLTGERQLVIGALADPPLQMVKGPCAVLVPAGNSAQRSLAKDLAPALLRAGCVEFCSVGEEAEVLHDALDEVLESRGEVAAVTTWIQDSVEACEYFLVAAGGEARWLLALVEGCPDIEKELTKLAKRLQCADGVGRS